MSLDGVIAIDKPEGMTSFKVVSWVRRKLKIKKVGHMGTLDPMATGVLPIMLGKATKALDLIENHRKKYMATIKFGISTDTQDITGNIVKHSDKIVDYDMLSESVDKFIGEVYQIPPMYSAIKKNGVKLYELARKGETIKREKRKIFIDSIGIVDFSDDKQQATILVVCSRGTYIRTLCADIGEALGCGGTMTSLRRIESNGFTINDCFSLSKFMELDKMEEIENKLMPIESLFCHFKRVNVTERQSTRFKNGGGLMLDRLKGDDAWINSSKHSVFQDNNFIGIGIVNADKNELSVFKLFN